MCDITHGRETNFINNPCHSAPFFRIPSSYVNLNWHILLQANPGSYGNQVFWCKRGSEVL